jgi:hypothetical protein
MSSFTHIPPYSASFYFYSGLQAALPLHIVVTIGRSNEILGWVGVGKIKPFRTV